MDKIVITGASGFIGGHVAEYFCSQGLRPLCMLRDVGKSAFLRTLPVELVQGDVRSPADLRPVFTGARLVIHTAAKVSDWGRYSDFHTVNVAGTVNVVRAAIEAGCSHVIITGTNSCYGEENSTVIKNEDSGYNPHYPYFLDRVFPSGLNHYRDTKAQGNTQAMELAARHNLDLTIIEPVWVYGEREFRSGFYEYLKTVGSGIPFFPGSAKNRFHTIYVRDLARLYYLAAKAHPRGVQRYLACDPTAEKQRTLFAMFCHAAGYRLPRRLPKFLVYPPALLMEAVAQLFGARRAPLLTRATVNIFYDNIEYSGDRARRELGFASAYAREESIRRTVAWYRDNNLL